jgi:nicotinate-nucleotide adenylyltransferase
MAQTLPIPRAEEFIALLRERIPEKTVAHSISAATVMNSLAGDVGISTEQACTAGLLHDCTKGMKGKELLRAAESYGLDITPSQQAKPKLLHGAVAAEECRRALGIDDPGVYDAIFWHTTGCPGLGPVGQALYFADFAEPLRSHSASAKALKLCEDRGFEVALRFVSDEKLRYIRTLAVFDPMTEAFNSWLAETFGKEA